MVTADDMILVGYLAPLPKTTVENSELRIGCECMEISTSLVSLTLQFGSF